MNDEITPKKNINLLIAPLLVLVCAGLLALMYGWVGTNRSVGNEKAEVPESRWVAAQVPIGPGQQANHVPGPVGMGIGSGVQGQVQVINTPTYPMGIGGGALDQMQLINTPGYPIGLGQGANGTIKLVNQAPVYMGLHLTVIDAGGAKRMGLGNQAVLLVLEIDPKGPAVESGIQKDDVILAVNRRNVTSLDQLAQALAFSKPGDAVKVLYSRNGHTKSTHLTVEAIPGLIPAAATIAPAWMGVDIQNIDAVIQSQFNLSSKNGVIVSNVTPNSPAAEAGILAGDVITRFSGSRIKTVRQFQKRIEKEKPGQAIKIDFIRGGNQQSVNLTLGQVPPPAPPPKVAPAEMVVEGSWIGMDVTELLAQEAPDFGFPAGTTGVLVNDVEGPPAMSVGFQTGDLITSINGTPTLTMKDFVKATKLQSGAVVDVLRGNRHLFITVPPPGFTQQGTPIDPGPAGNFRQVAAVTQPDTARIGILSDNPGLNGRVSGESLQPAYLILVDLGQNSHTTMQLTDTGQLDHLLSRNQVAVLIVSDISTASAARYNAMGVVVYSGVVGSGAEALDLYNRGLLVTNR